MICANLSDAKRYKGIHPRLDRALDLLTAETLQAIGTERQSIEGDALFATRFDVTTCADESRLFEYHRRYIDIFTLMQGCERVDIASPEAIAVTAHSGDYWGGKGTPEQSLILTPGRFLILFPGDAHRPGMSAAETENISRIVFKILIEEV